MKIIVKNKLIYNVLLCLLLAFINLSQYIDNKPTLFENFFRVAFISITILLTFYWITNITKKNLLYKQAFLLLLVFALFIFGLIFKTRSIIVTALMISFSLLIPVNTIIDVYCFSFLLVLIIFGIMRIFLSGISMNKNVVGYFVFNVGLLLFFKLQNKNNNIRIKLLKNILLIITSLFEYFIGDKTALFLFLFFIVFYYLAPLLSGNKALKLLVIVLPIMLSILGVYLSFNFGKNVFVTDTLDKILSHRIALWNNIWNIYQKPTLFPQNVLDNAYSYSYLLGVTVHAADGYFSIGIIQDGIIIYSIYLLLIICALVKFYRIKDKNEKFFYFVFLMILYNFTETLIDRGSFCLIIPLVYAYIANIGYREEINTKNGN